MKRLSIFRLQPVDEPVIKRRNLAVLSRAQPLQPSLAGMHPNAIRSRILGALDEIAKRHFRILIVDADTAFDRNRNLDRRLHRRDAVGDQCGLLHQTGAEGAGLHPV